MADTATYAGAMKTSYPDTGPHTARKVGDARPSKGSGDLTARQRRSAAQKRLGKRYGGRKATGARDVTPGPRANGIVPL